MCRRIHKKRPGGRMSIQSMSDLAVKRDRSTPRGPVSETQDIRSTTEDRQQGGTPVSYSDALVKAIPTEPLAAYVAVIAIFATIPEAEGRYLPARWWVFAGFMALTAVALIVSYRSKACAPVGQGVEASGGNQRPLPGF